MDSLNELLKQPWAIQVALASGHAAYMVSFTGVRAHHKAVDIAFGTLTLGLLASAILGILAPRSGPILSGLLAFLITLAFGLLWRKYLGPLCRGLLRWMNISWSDDTPSALAAVVDDTSTGLSQISVTLKDGTQLSCNDARIYKDAPFGPCRIGPNGDIAFYVDRKKEVGKDAVTIGDVLNDEVGARITYIPAANIERIALRKRRL